MSRWELNLTTALPRPDGQRGPSVTGAQRFRMSF
jgi:hypothetical protein